MGRRHRSLPRRLARYLRWGLRIFLVLMIADLLYVASIWPDWKQLAQGIIPKSNFIAVYEEHRADKKWPQLRWQPVPLSAIPKPLTRAVLLGEDIRFYDHSGFDLIAIKEALDYNLAKGEMVFGASTISQQTSKNLFLSASRNPVRKWHEVLLTWGLEHNLTKHRILEIYLNTAEFGRGVYGVEAAAQAYWGVPVSRLSVVQAAELAATLPSPIKHNPKTQTETFTKRAQRILTRLTREYELKSQGQVDGEETPPVFAPDMDDEGLSAPPVEDNSTHMLRTI